MQITRVAPLLAPLWHMGPLPARRAGAAAPQPWVDAPMCRVLLVEGWDDEAEGTGAHWVGITHDGSVQCVLRAVRPLAPPRDARAAAAAVLASTPRVYALCYAMLPAPGAPQSPRSTPARRATPTLGRGARSASSWWRGGGAAGCRSCSKRPDPGVRSRGSPAAEAAEALPPPPFPPPPPSPPPPGPVSGGAWRTGTLTPPPPQGGGFYAPPRPRGNEAGAD